MQPDDPARFSDHAAVSIPTGRRAPMQPLRMAPLTVSLHICSLPSAPSATNATSVRDGLQVNDVHVVP